MSIEKIEDEDIILDKEINKLLKPQPSVELDKTFTHIIQECSFGDLSKNTIYKIFKDGRPFSKFIERWLEQYYPLIYIPGDKDHDHKDKFHHEILYDAKTFTKGGC